MSLSPMPPEPERPAVPEPERPAIPPGPGTAPPFAVAPAEGRGIRLWWGLGVGAAALMLCVGGGLAALVGIVVTFSKALQEQATTVVGDYLDALHEQKYPEAYGLLCDRRQEIETEAEYASRQAREPRPASYELGEMDLTTLELEADITFTDGTSEAVRITLAQDSSTGRLEVCGTTP